MTTFHKHDQVRSGVYFSISPPDLCFVHEDGLLDGLRSARYRRVPLLLVLALGPVIGGLYAVAFPLVIFWALAQALGRELARRRTYEAGDSVPWGVYLGLNRASLRYVGSAGEPLGGRPRTRYFRVPTFLCVLASPAVGGAYVVAFPFILAGGLFLVLAELVVAAATHQWQAHTHIVLPHWEPSAAYLTPPAASPEPTTVSEPSETRLPELDALEAEVRARQAQERADEERARRAERVRPAQS